MKINYCKEIIKGFKKQFPKRIESYNSLLQPQTPPYRFKETLVIYEQFLEDTKILIKIVNDLGDNRRPTSSRKIMRRPTTRRRIRR